MNDQNDQEGQYYQTTGEVELTIDSREFLAVGATTVLKLTKLLAGNPPLPLRHKVRVVYRDEQGTLRESKDEFFIPATTWRDAVRTLSHPLGEDVQPAKKAFAQIALQQANYRQMLTKVLRGA